MTVRIIRFLSVGLIAIRGVVAQSPAPSALPPAHQALARELLRQLVEINTSDSAGHTADAAEAVAQRLRTAGLPAADIQVLHPDAHIGMLVARLRGKATGKRPILLMAHLDVVPARREDWSVDPFTLLEKDGWFYGRGTSDNKAGDATLVETFTRYLQEKFVPDRDLIMVLTGDEETTGNSIDWVLRTHHDLVDAEFALNTDAGAGIERGGRRIAFTVQASEKVYFTYQLEVRNRGGHSSLPRPDNAITTLARGLDRLARYNFPVVLNEITRTFFSRAAVLDTGGVAADMRAVAATGDSAAAARLSATPLYNAMLRTTCVATRLEGGHADNALPQVARGVVNCRILPGMPPADVQRTIVQVLADTAIAVTVRQETPASPASALTPAIMGPIERTAAQLFPGVTIIPDMSTGATDGLFTRNAGIPTYGTGALFGDPNDERAHGRDERVGVTAFYDAVEFWYRLLKALTSRS